MVDRNGNATSYRYGDKGNVIEKFDALGNRWAYAYDNKGNPLAEIDPPGNASRMTYDGAGILLSERDAAGNETKYAYSGHLPTFITDPLGRKTTSHNPSGYTDPLGNATAFSYDKSGRMTAMTDPAGNVQLYLRSGRAAGGTDRSAAADHTVRLRRRRPADIGYGCLESGHEI